MYRFATFVNLFVLVSCSFRAFEGSPEYFPWQRADLDHPNGFFRINEDGIDALTCPDAFTFDSQQLKCVHRPSMDRTQELSEVSCPANFRGPTANPEDCKTFVDCWDGRGAVSNCAATLLFNDQTKQCDYAVRANCCEYWETTPDKLV